MNDFTFDRVFSPWEMALSKLNRGDVLSASRFIALMEQDDTVEPEQAAFDLERKGVMLDVSDLPRIHGSAGMRQRLELEEKLYRDGTVLSELDQNDTLRLYLEQIQDLAPSVNEEELALQARAGSTKAMQKLTDGNLYRVYELAGKYLNRGVLLVDLMQEGNLGLCQSVMNYEGGCFREHSGWWICQAMARAVTLQAHANGVGTHMAHAMERYREADRALLTRLGRNPGHEEIALEMGVTPEEAAAVGKMLREAESMERVRQADAPKEPEPDEEHAVEDTAYFQSRQRINEMLSELSETDAEILTMRFGLDGKPPMTARQVGEKLNLTQGEVTQREAAALAALRRDG